MTKGELIKRLIVLQDSGDPEAAHAEADRLLIEFINEPDVAAAYDGITWWHA